MAFILILKMIRSWSIKQILACAAMPSVFHSFVWVLYSHLPPRICCAGVGFFPVQPCSRVPVLGVGFCGSASWLCSPSVRSAGVGPCAWVSSMCVQWSAAEI